MKFAKQDLCHTCYWRYQINLSTKLYLPINELKLIKFRNFKLELRLLIIFKSHDFALFTSKNLGCLDCIIEYTLDEADQNELLLYGSHLYRLLLQDS